jgi:hypothetical protein
MPEQTDFNMSVATLIRIDALLTSANSFKIANDVYKWFLVLMGLYSELSVFIDPKEREDFIERVKVFSNRFSNIFEDIANDRPYNTTLTDYLDLLSFEIDLRTIAKENGLLIKFKELDDIDDF